MGLEETIYRTRDEHANHYTTEKETGTGKWYERGAKKKLLSKSSL
jgi:hypothetical protein